ncbi:MAG: YajQ family cyclic di-GMP-binding protein [Legionellales bacterium]|nr:YajQ family cyclic di-GMP-binding protein [Legionellales bacterium]
MPTFDIVSEIDQHELNNAVDQANREITSRFDFKGVEASFEYKDEKITLVAPSDFQVQQMQDILNSKLAKRNIDIRCLDYQKMETNLSQARIVALVKQGLETESAKKIIKFIKDNKYKVQTSIQADQVRVIGKQRDDLQTVISALKAEDLGVPLQYKNFRD